MTRMLRDGIIMVPYSVAWHPCLQPAMMASAGWSGFDTLEPARWVGGTGAMSSGLEDGLDKVSALRFAACNTRVRSGATNRHSASGASRSWY